MSFDVCWLQHASMNTADKAQLFRELHRVLRPGGRLALHEIMRGAVEPVRLPAPWASRPEPSFLEAPDEVRRLLRDAGFRELLWEDVADESLAWWRERVAAAADGSPPLGLHLLIGETAPAVGANLVRNLDERRIVVARAVLERAPP